MIKLVFFSSKNSYFCSKMPVLAWFSVEITILRPVFWSFCRFSQKSVKIWQKVTFFDSFRRGEKGSIFDQNLTFSKMGDPPNFGAQLDGPPRWAQKRGFLRNLIRRGGSKNRIFPFWAENRPFFWPFLGSKRSQFSVGFVRADLKNNPLFRNCSIRPF